MTSDYENPDKKTENGVRQNNFLYDYTCCNNLTLSDDIDPDINFYEPEVTSTVYDTPSYYSPYEEMKIINNQENAFPILSFNIRSLRKNFDEFKIFLHCCPVKFLAICIQETWSKDEEDRAFLENEFSLNGYNFHNYPRTNDKRGGGLCIYISKTLNVKLRKDFSISIPDAEIQVLEIINSKNTKNIILANIYRPPSGKIKNFKSSLQKVMKYAKQSSKPTYICGDYNLNFLSYDTDPKVRLFLQKMNEYFFIPAISKPTRVHKSKSTCIDNFFLNSNFEQGVHSGIIHEKISDHFPIFIIAENAFSGEVNKETKSKVKKRNYTQENISKFQEQLKLISWATVLNERDANVCYEKFLNEFEDLYDNCFPIEIKTVKTKSVLNKWITKGLIKSSRRKQSLYNRFLKNRTVENEKKYKNYAKIFNRIKEKSKIEYYSRLIKKHQNNIKKTWDIMKEIISRKKATHKIPSRINRNGKSYTDPLEMAEEFNNFFINVGPDLASQIKNNSSKSYEKFLSKVQNKFIMNEVTENELKSAFNSLKRNKGPGFDDINANQVKPCFDSLKLPLLHIFNCSLQSGIFPDKMKIAKILPVFKSGDDSDISNYRPISLLPLFSKLLEKVMHSKLYNYMEENKLFFYKQFGFRKKSSVDYGLLEIVNDITEAMNKHQLTLGVFIDLSKAFDTVDHTILLNKLEKYGVLANEQKWFNSYLTNRFQYVNIGDKSSSLKLVKCGVPQGSILGPLLFLIYINDMKNSAPLLDIIMFADDTNLFSTGKDLKTLFKTMNEQLTEITNWFSANKLSLNIKKTKYILFCSSNDEDNLPLKLPVLKIGNKNIERTRFTKFLGVLLDENLNWKCQIQAVETKVSKQIGIICKARKFLDNNAMKHLYFAFVHPYFSYGNIVWGATAKHKLNRLHNLQKRAVRIISYAPRGSHSRPLMIQRNILNVFELNIFQTLCFMHKAHNSQIPDCLQDKFHLHKSKYPQRHVFFRQKDMGKYNRYNISKRGPFLWNNFKEVTAEMIKLKNPKYYIRLKLLTVTQTHIW